MRTLNNLLPTPRANDPLKAGKIADDPRNGLPAAILHHSSSLGGSPVSLFLPLDEEEERQTTVISGRKCFASYESLLRYGSSLKTCAASLLGATAWYSNKCALTWKVQATKSNRLLFQLSPSTRPTEEKEFGLLPTAQAIDGKGKGRPFRLKKDMPRDPSKPGSWRGDLKDHIAMLPTPRAQEANGGIEKTENGQIIRKNGTCHGAKIKDIVGTDLGLKLQPNFVEWMMGYPPNWTDLNSPSPLIDVNDLKASATP